MSDSVFAVVSVGDLLDFPWPDIDSEGGGLDVYGHILAVIYGIVTVGGVADGPDSQFVNLIRAVALDGLEFDGICVELAVYLQFGNESCLLNGPVIWVSI